MSCNCCCTKILSLCKFSVCGDIDFGIQAVQGGTHTLELEFLGVTFTKEKHFEGDDDIIFPASGLNENYIYTGKLFDPDGKQIVIKKGDIEYDCFSFETSLAYAIVDEEEGS